MMEQVSVLDVIDKGTVLTHLQVHSKAEVLERMANSLEEAGYLQDKALYLDDVYSREAEGSTGIGGYIAIPHGKSAGVKKAGVSIAVLDEEIPWESLDGMGVKGIILFAVSSDDTGAREHLKLLSMFARKLGRENVVNDLLAADTADDVKKAFMN